MADYPGDDEEEFELDDDEEELRDQFAALALSGLIANGNPKLAFEDSNAPDKCAKRSYEYADAMMRARRTTH